MADIKITGKKAGTTAGVSIIVVTAAQMMVKLAASHGIEIDDVSAVAIISIVAGGLHGIFDGLKNFTKHWVSEKKGLK